MFSVLLLAVTVGISEACFKIPQYFGTLKPALQVGHPAMLTSGCTSCTCCAMCHQEPSCASLSFNTSNNECRLYSTVGSYADLMRQGQDDENVKFFIMPGRSGSGEFCRSNADCQTLGDQCTAKVCTTNTTITCGTLYKQNSDLPSHRYWGVIDGKELLLNCKMEYRTGFTMLLASSISNKWTVENRLNYTDATGQGRYPNDWSLYSILWAADKFRDSENGSFYQVLVRGVAHLTDGDMTSDVLFNASKTQSLLGKVAVAVDYIMPKGDEDNYNGEVCFPYMLEKAVLYQMFRAYNYGYGGLIRRNGQLVWFKSSSVSIAYVDIYIGH